MNNEIAEGGQVLEPIQPVTNQTGEWIESIVVLCKTWMY